VLVQVGLEGKGLVATLTLVVLESRMGLHVSSETGTNYLRSSCNYRLNEYTNKQY
jgi:hypothetical protein